MPLTASPLHKLRFAFKYRLIAKSALEICMDHLTSAASRSKISPIHPEPPIPIERRMFGKFMTPSQPSQSPQKKATPEPCKHPRVQIVSRDEDSEYVECQECREVFESSELKDMVIEEKKEDEDTADED
jgi:hypothetical protein